MGRRGRCGTPGKVVHLALGFDNNVVEVVGKFTKEARQVGQSWHSMPLHPLTLRKAWHVARLPTSNFHYPLYYLLSKLSHVTAAKLSSNRAHDQREDGPFLPQPKE
jgi:hypothetical protein